MGPATSERSRRHSSNSQTPAESEVVAYDGTVRPGLLEQYRYEIRLALETDLGIMIRRNEQVWEFTLHRFEAELKAHIDRGTLQVLKKLSEGPHTNITDPILRRIWEAEVYDSLSRTAKH